MLSIIQAKNEHLSNIYTMIIALAQYEGIEEKIKITRKGLEDLLFCAAPQHFVSVAVLNDQLVGFVMFNYTYHNICVNVLKGIYIENLYVLPAFRQQGVGTALLKFVAEKAHHEACSRIEWWVSRTNEAASDFYKKIGAIALNEWSVFKCDYRGIANLLEIGSVV